MVAHLPGRELAMRRAALVLLLALAVLVVGASASSADRSASSRVLITPSPAYTADQLAAPAGDNWLTNMGSLNGNRYSSLTQITPANVGTLKEAWHIHLGTCPTKDQQCGSLEANAVVADGVYYIQTPKSDVFALDAATGATLWHYVPTFVVAPPCVPTGSCEPGFTVGTGGRQPGVAIGEGKVFIPTRDGYLIALDQMLGAQIWKTEVLPWMKGGQVSDAPSTTTAWSSPATAAVTAAAPATACMPTTRATAGRSGPGPSCRSRVRPAATPGQPPTHTTAAVRCGSHPSSTRSSTSRSSVPATRSRGTHADRARTSIRIRSSP